MKSSKLYLSVVLSILFSAVAVGQTIDWGKEQKSKNKSFYPHIIADDEESLFSYSSEGGDLIVSKYSREDFRREYQTEVPELKIDKERVKVEEITVMKNNFVVLGTYYKKHGKGDRKNHIVIYKIDKQSGKVIQGHKELFSVDVEKSYRKGAFNITVSKDRTRILIMHSAYYRKKSRTIASFKLYDEELELLEEFTEDFKERSEENAIDKINNLLIDNEGSIYYLAGTNKIVSLDANKNFEKWEEQIDLSEMKPGSAITRMRFRLNTDGDIVAFGFYNEAQVGLRGVFYLKIDFLTKEMAVQKLSEFEDEFLEQFKTKRQKKKGREAVVHDQFNNIEILFKEDGGIAVVAETYQYYYVTYDNGFAERAVYGPLLAIDLNADGQLQWVKKIDKNQYFHQQTVSYFVLGTFVGGVRLLFGVNSYHYTKYFSVVSMIKDDKLVIVYNEHLKNNSKTDDKKRKSVKSVKSTRPYAISLNLENGEISEGNVKGKNSKTAPLAPVMSYKTTDGKSIIVFGQKKKVYKLGSIKLN